MSTRCQDKFVLLFTIFGCQPSPTPVSKDELDSLCTVYHVPSWVQGFRFGCSPETQGRIHEYFVATFT